MKYQLVGLIEITLEKIMSMLQKILVLIICSLPFAVLQANDDFESLGLKGLVNVDCQSSNKPPLILIHGTFANTKRAFSSMAPLLKQQGYCLYAINYGREGTLSFNGTKDINQSVEQISHFTKTVKQKTGATKVSLIGHSQGGLLAFLVARSPEMAGQVQHVVALAPSLNGTTIVPKSFRSTHCPACAQLGAQSEFMQTVRQDKLNPQGVRSLIVATRQDLVVVPVKRQFLHEPDVTNILLQEKHPSVYASHSGLLHVPEAIELVINFLKTS